jgi:hypothetical protein
MKRWADTVHGGCVWFEVKVGWGEGNTVHSIFLDHAATKNYSSVVYLALHDSHLNTIKTVATIFHLSMYIQLNTPFVYAVSFSKNTVKSVNWQLGPVHQ